MRDLYTGDLLSSLEGHEKHPEGFHFLPRCLDAPKQQLLMADVKMLLAEAPLFQQTMPRSGAALSVRTSNAGKYGWVTNREHGYRYQMTHPVTRRPWPKIPERFLALWAELTGETQMPNLCLVNLYDEHAKLGLHQDGGESSLEAPVLSISLGDDAIFMVGGFTRKDATRQLALQSGDVVWFGGKSRLIFHGLKSILKGTSDLLQSNGLSGRRINLTLRRIGIN